MATMEEKIKAALAHKDQGNEAFKQGDMKQALTQYHHAVLGLSGLDNKMTGMSMLSGMPPAPGAPESSSSGSGGSATDDQKNEIKTNLAVVYSNMGACHLKNQNYKRAIEVCNKALQYDPANVKAKFRRAQAKLQEGNLAGAEADLNSLGEGVPGVKAELEKLKKKSKDADEKQRKTMGGFLSRGRIIDEEEEERENAARSSSSSTTTTTAPVPTTAAPTTPAPRTTPKSKPTLASKMNAGRKPRPVPREEEYVSTSWSGTAPKIQELAEGEE
ncbi:hypothetical protein BGZ74_005829 [Mortierella antarctica]|nr:hypothetical protein BGZ74_005829 [Mortierella antarctica]KAG0350250.1 hypothetical protein BG005_010215 [Podila minutissima]